MLLLLAMDYGFDAYGHILIWTWSNTFLHPLWGHVVQKMMLA